MGAAVYETIKASRDLPSPTGVTLEILRLASDKKSTMQELSSLIEADPALASRVLKLVNSPFAGMPRQIASIERAVGLLGPRTITGLALSFSLISGHGKGPCRGFDYGAFWSESLARAVAAKHIAQSIRGFAPDEVFTCGLVSQIGRLAFATAFPDTYADAIKEAVEGDHIALAKAEYAVFGIDHPRLAAELMRDWHLPDLFREAVLLQNLPDENRAGAKTRSVQLAKVLHTSGLIAGVLTCKDVAHAVLSDLSKAFGALGMAEAQLTYAIDAIGTEWRGAGQMFSVATRDVPPAATIYAQAVELRGAQRALPGGSTLAAGDENLLSGTETIRVLVVDHDPDVRVLLATYLSGAGYAVVQASDGKEALQFLLADGPPIVITGLEMPNMDGLSLCRAIRTHPGVAFTYVILSTARDAGEDKIVEALDAGADNVLTKPFRRNELLARLRAAERIAKLQLDLDAQRREVHKYNAEMEIANAKLASANDDLVRMATTDELTGLVNRREALHRLAQEWASAERNRAPLAIISLDIDLFKGFNDTYGHAAGDAVLKETAEAMRRTLRLEETVCRIGGEEFLVLCPQTDEQHAAICAERIRRAVEAHIVRFHDVALQVTVSLGVAERNAQTQTPDDLLRSADKALYAAKHAGRNAVVIASKCTAAANTSSSGARVEKPKAVIAAPSSK
ncbi:MAG: diguanylate cyclase [Planctomycetes bacterium]|nr:diguanylate cyclase [Planctomycetota bacterium]